MGSERSPLTPQEEKWLDKLDAYAASSAGLAFETDMILRRLGKSQDSAEALQELVREMYGVRTKLGQLQSDLQETECPTVRCAEAWQLCAYAVKAQHFWTDCLCGYLTSDDPIFERAMKGLHPVVKQFGARFDELCRGLSPNRYGGRK
jgi:hypothetical protein